MLTVYELSSQVYISEHKAYCNLCDYFSIVIDMDSIQNSTAIETSDKSSSNIEAPSSPRRPPVGMNEDDLHSVSTVIAEEGRVFGMGVLL